MITHGNLFLRSACDLIFRQTTSAIGRGRSSDSSEIEADLNVYVIAWQAMLLHCKQCVHRLRIRADNV